MSKINKCITIIFSYKVVELVAGGSVINGASPPSLQESSDIKLNIALTGAQGTAKTVDI